MTSKKDVIRFAVGNRDDVRSSIWRLWATRNDLYLASRSHAHISKISFHETGNYRYAINEIVERENSITDRAVHKWHRPKEYIPGWTRCFGILVPPRITKIPFSNIFEGNEMIEFVNPSKKVQKIIFNILLSHKTARPEHIVRGSAHDITIHGYVEMPREFAWLVSFYEDFTPAENAVVTDHFNKLKIHLKPGSTGEGINNTFLHVFQEGSVPFLINIELGRENLDIPLVT